MKNLIAVLALCTACFYMFASCSDDAGEGLDADTNVITCNGKVCSHLASAFSGGGVSNPEAGVYTRLNIFDQNYSSFPSNTTAKVSIGGLLRHDVTYMGNGDYLERIRLGFVDKYEVDVSLNQGVFEGKDGFSESNTHVSSVMIHSYSLGETDDQGNIKGNANIHITIKMDDSSVIEIKYSGKVRSDGMIG